MEKEGRMINEIIRIHILLRGIVYTALLIGGLLVGSVQAGSLDPPPSAAPGGTPAPTMKTQDQLRPSWDQILPADDTGDPCNSKRFTCVLPGPGGSGVRDNETGLVWVSTPNVFSNNSGSWENAHKGCIQANAFQRFGWRLPSIAELTTLLDPGETPRLPNGHPFIMDVNRIVFWSATIDAGNAANAWIVRFNNTSPVVASVPKTTSLYFWCVRGGGLLSE